MRDEKKKITHDDILNEMENFDKKISKNEKEDIECNDFGLKDTKKYVLNINAKEYVKSNNFNPSNSLKKTQFASINEENNQSQPEIQNSSPNIIGEKTDEIISPNIIEQDKKEEKNPNKINNINNNINININSNLNQINQVENQFQKLDLINEIKPIPTQDVKDILNYQPQDIYPLLPKNLSPIQLTKDAILVSLSNQATTIILQKIIMETKYEVIKSIVYELHGIYRQIINDKNGNYFCSDLFKVCEQNERIMILIELSPTLSEDCVNNYATHPIQTLIQFSSSEKEYQLILSSFNDYNKLLFASLSPNGAYAIQKIIERIPERYRTDFNFIFTSFIAFVSKKKFGIVTVKKFISCTKNEEITTQILTLIRNNFMNLAMDVYGNYLIQFLLEKWNNISEGNEIKELVTSNFKLLSESKYSSFICEMYIKIASKDEKKQLINSLTSQGIQNTNNPFSIKIMKCLGFFNNQLENKSYNNNVNFPFSLHNNSSTSSTDSSIQNSSYSVIPNYNNFTFQNNNTNNNSTTNNNNNNNRIFEEDNFPHHHKNNNKKKHKKK